MLTRCTVLMLSLVPPRERAELMATRASKVSMITCIAPERVEERALVEAVS